MSRIAAPMLGGMVTAPLLSLFIVPAAYALLRRPRWRLPPRGPVPPCADRSAPGNPMCEPARVEGPWPS
jgi:hypothetical protein